MPERTRPPQGGFRVLGDGVDRQDRGKNPEGEAGGLQVDAAGRVEGAGDETDETEYEQEQIDHDVTSFVQMQKDPAEERGQSALLGGGAGRIAKDARTTPC